MCFQSVQLWRCVDDDAVAGYLHSLQVVSSMVSSWYWYTWSILLEVDILLDLNCGTGSVDTLGCISGCGLQDVND